MSDALAAPNRPKYFAFLSYAHNDAQKAAALSRYLETFRVPVKLGGKEQQLPKRMYPIFRDRDEFSASSDLGAAIQEALASSGALVVLCSPAAAQSRWVDAEIRTFRKVRTPKRIFAVILDGEPDEAFPAALTEGGIEPLAVDFRQHVDVKRDARLRLVAALLNIEFDALKRREARRKRDAYIRFGAAAVTVASVLALSYARYDGLAKVRSADQLAAISQQQPAFDRVGALLAARAYQLAPGPVTESALLRQAAHLTALRSTWIPSEATLSISNHGLDVITFDGANATIFDARTLQTLRRAAIAQYDDACAFPESSMFATLRGNVVSIHNDHGTIAQRYTSDGVSAFACVGSDTIVVLNQSGRLIVYSPRSVGGAVLRGRMEPTLGKPVSVAVAPRNDIIAAIANRGFAVYDLTTNRQIAITRGDLTDNPIGQPFLQFSDNGKWVAWQTFDDFTLRLARVSALNAVRRFALPFDRERSIITFLPCSGGYFANFRSRDAAAGLPPAIVSAVDHVTCIYNVPKHTYAATSSSNGATECSLDCSTSPSTLVYDAPLDEFLSVDGNDDNYTLAARSLNATIAFPLLGRQAAPPIPPGFALERNWLIVPGEHGIRRYDLTRYGTQSDSANDVSSARSLFDGGDGRALLYDSQTGDARIVKDASMQESAAFRLPKGSGIQLAFDGAANTIVVLNGAVVQRFDSSGRSLSTTALAHELTRGRAPCLTGPMYLSSLGRYIIPCVRSCFISTATLAKRCPSSLSWYDYISQIVSQDHYLVTDKGRLFTLPDLILVEGAPVSDVLAVSHRRRFMAELNPAGGEIQLIDFSTHENVGPALALPHDSSDHLIDPTYVSAAFTADDSDLVVHYLSSDGARAWPYVAVYDVDPADWQQAVCMAAGRPLSIADLRELNQPVTRYADPCGR